MARQERAVTAETLGAWLLKCHPNASPVEEFVRTGFATVTSRCIRPTYRADEVAAGQPVLFWISGDDGRHPAGIYAHGEATGPAHLAGRDGLVMPVRLTPLHPPIPRRGLREHPQLSALEVLRMPAGSNPSYVTREQLALLREVFPHMAAG